MIHRVTHTIAKWGIEDGYFASEEDGERFYRELTWLCLHQHGAFNSPVWFNVGLAAEYGVKGAACNWHFDPDTQKLHQPDNPYDYPQASACFIQSGWRQYEDIRNSLAAKPCCLSLAQALETDLSTIRSQREKLSGGGKPSGRCRSCVCMTKLQQWSRAVARLVAQPKCNPSGLASRCDGIIECKAKEEKKARGLIEKGGYESNSNGEAYSSILFRMQICQYV